MKTKKWFGVLLGLSLAALLVAPTANLATVATCGTEVVTESDIARQPEPTQTVPSPPTKDWVLYTRAGTPPTAGQFVTGPAPAPLGDGSFRFQTVTASEKAFLFNYDHEGKLLKDIDTIKYSTYRTAGSGQQVAALNIVIDYNGPNVAGGFSTLVFEPVYNTTQGPVVSGQWQTWDAFSANATWWSSRAINGQCAGATSACDKTWAEIVANNPDAIILGGFGINQGSGNGGLTTSVDKLVIGFDGCTTTYDFERDADGDGSGDGEDCDDNDNTVYPGAAEVCDGKDNDCDGQIDEGVKNTFYRDADGDGFGDSSASAEACSAPAGHVSVGGDCLDSDNTVYPNAPELCDGKDNDCDGLTDEGFVNSDGDGMADCIDPDDDNDGVADVSDACPGTAAGTTVNASGCPLVENKDQCKGGGWQTLRRADNTTFKNQGDCVSYMSSGK